MKRIIIHWTAGAYWANAVDLQHYHFLIQGDGVILDGNFKPKNNENVRNGRYAQHTGGGNTGSIGVAMCGMLGFVNSNIIGKYPLTLKQCETCFKEVAKLCKQYKISVKPDTVLTHYEFGLKHTDTSSRGKIDIIHLPPFAWIPQEDIGAFIRSKVRWYLLKEDF